MDIDTLKQLLQSVADGKTQVDSAASRLAHIAFEDIDYAHVDHHRSLRKGFPEVIFGEGKTAGQIAGIMDRMTAQENVVLVTRIDPEKAETVMSPISGASYHEDAKMLIWKKGDIPEKGKGTILVISAGTSDIPVAREAFLTAGAMGNHVESIFDVGVAGIHRLFHHKEKIDGATVLIVVAGMEGALPSVVAGLSDRPVIAVPTSIGYGASFGGIAALLGMLTSCGSGVSVVNIDNGFGAAFSASRINRL